MDTELTDTEIELKFLVSDNVIAHIPAIITEFAKKVINKPSKNLQNAYFDTVNRELRALDIGLRTRCFGGETYNDNHCEQTIKLAGQVVGGLHQRPEYNLPLEGKYPDLSLFDANIWPYGMQIDEINKNIYTIFTTHFIRRTWILETESGTKIELVLDKGEISASNQVETICEVEMELVSGSRADLFDLAKKLIAHSEVRLGLYSKAARGYRIADNQPLTADIALSSVSLEQDSTLEQTFSLCLQYGIEFVQKHEQCYFDAPALHILKRINDGVSLIHHAFGLFNNILNKDKIKPLLDELNWLLNELNWVETAVQLKNYTSKKHAYYKKIKSAPELNQVIDNLKLQHPDVGKMHQVFCSARYNHLILNLTIFLVDASWKNDWNASHLQIAEQKVTDKAASLFEKDWHEIRGLIASDQDISEKAYIAQKAQLERNLLSGCCLGDLFNQTLREEFRTPWLDIIHGIDELCTLDYLKRLCVQQNDDSLNKMKMWLEQKSENLLSAMEQSRLATFKSSPYWR
ncbi:inorganic triphosphatase [Pseudoalteromonas sp. NBT06-2]|uniref:CYTH domain-containing protein n=1 Tax=Pseudoalteromonas sp. NBT06-2 TaxID=2025950 RepID=UPI000BA61FA7|nr:CYTH and CHAD domain-containing protein [Pseudoalteromonas sp. NBT06-2]PAJ76059.1 inorganic triphosphatase [Pseudoalteromonas sp. NBT06-2]